jgi:hypothetical protein
MKVYDIPKSGKAGKVIVSRNHYGQYERAYVKPRDPRTPKQLSWRKAWGKASKAWGKLTEAQRLAWNEAAKGVRSRPWMGRSRRLTGQAYFVKANARRLSKGQALLCWPPQP